jgi:hypothetical protein
MEIGGYNNSVFINCPFDKDNKPILYAVIYVVYRCGFYPKTALDEDDGSESRLSKIIRKIKDCRYGIHDLSRIESNENGYPRFNMPFELGIFFGAKNLGDDEQKSKRVLIFERKKYTYQQYISDLNGIDPKAHQNNPSIAMRKIRDWLRVCSDRPTIPGNTMIAADYIQFKKKASEIIRRFGFYAKDLSLSDFRTVVEEIVFQQIGWANYLSAI